MLMLISPGLIEQDDAVHFRLGKSVQLAADRLGRPDQTTAQRALGVLGVFPLPFQILFPQVHRPGCGALAVARPAVVGERELEERHTVGAPARLLVRLRAHEVADHRDVAVALIVRELLLPLDERVVVGMHPGMRHLGAEELKAQRADAAAAGKLDGLELRAGDPQRRVWLLHRLGQHVAQRELEIRAVVLPAFMREHRHDAAHRVFPHRLLVFHLAIERSQLGDAGALAHTELDAPVAHQVEARDLLRDARGMVGRKLDDAVAEPDVLGSLTCGGEEHLGLRRMRILLEEMVLHFPCVVVAKPVGEFHLRQGVLIKLPLIVLRPGARQLQFVEYAEFHAAPPSVPSLRHCQVAR